MHLQPFCVSDFLFFSELRIQYRIRTTPPRPFQYRFGARKWMKKGWLQYQPKWNRHRKWWMDWKRLATGNPKKGNFVPEQHTDYIFSTIGEEWGFWGHLLWSSLFHWSFDYWLTLNVKIHFGRVYGYSVASILFFHFLWMLGWLRACCPP